MRRLAAYAGEALAALWRNRVRSFLTMLGMIVGTSSIIGVLGVSRAASGGIGSTLASFGDPGAIVAVDDNQDDPAAAAIQFRDVAALEGATAGTVSKIVPNYNETYALHANGINYDATVSSQEGHPDDTLTLYAGRRIDANDIASAARVTLLSEPLYHRFFGNAPAVGQVLRIGGSRFRIIGVYDAFKSTLLSTVAGEDYIEIPYTAFHELRPGPVDFLQVFAAPGSSVTAAGDATVAQLRRLHGSRAKYTTQDATAQLAGFSAALGLVAVGLTAIGSVALLVAGIGIMNVMLVCVAERTREIGLRKSVGATRGDITLQFLMEATLLSLIGGGLGALLGLAATLASYGTIEHYVGPTSVPYVSIVAVAAGFSIVVGTVFGTYPALRAARLDPIEALRS